MPSIIFPSLAFLNSLYSSMCSTTYTPDGEISGSIQSFIINYLTTINETNYTNMVNAIKIWIESTTIPHLATGLQVGIPANIFIPGLKVQIMEADGITAYNSRAGANNIFKYRNIPHPDFLTNSRYWIDDNQGTRTYYQGAMLSQSGIYSMKKRSNGSQTNQIYLSVRQGLSPQEPFGVVVISMNTELNN